MTMTDRNEINGRRKLDMTFPNFVSSGWSEVKG